MSEEKTQDPFDDCDYYDASENPEQLTNGSPEEAIEDVLDGEFYPACDAEAEIRKYGEIEVVGYVRKAVDPKTAKLWAERFADLMNEWWPEEEYGNPEDDADGPGNAQFIEEVLPVIQAALDRTEVWQCESVAKRTYSVDDVLAMMREENPDWFEDQENADHPLYKVARWLDDWAYTDSHVRLDRQKLRELLAEDEATAGYLPTEDQCREFIVGEHDTGAPPAKLVADFPKTNAFLESCWE